MEDFFQILIFIIFIISSIISSKNKKKKKQQKSKTLGNNPKISSTQKPQKTQQEIFEELFGLKPKPEVPPVGVITETPKAEKTVYKTWYAEDDFKKTKHNDNYSFKDKVQNTKEQLEKEKQEHEALTKKTKSRKTVKKNKYQKLFQNPSTLRDYIIVSEILNKPKALVRR
jgi:hypothetical protein